jgi:dTDP-4-dehydrorhamnose reductase
VVVLKILVTGASGLLGRRVVELALERGHRVYSAYREHVLSIGVPVRLDITDEERLLKTVSEIRPDAIIHAAAYTDVDGCEANRDLAWRVNSEATRSLAAASAETGSFMVFVSTDYVFDGEKGLYSEDDQPNPVNYYGYTKLKGEEFVRENAAEWCVARTSVIYGWNPVGKPNFATWVVSSLSQGREVKALTDQYVSPTFNTNLAEMLLEIVEKRVTGIIHAAGAERVSRYWFSVKLAEAFGLNRSLVKPAVMSEMRWRARRPRDSSLNVSKAEALLSHKPLRLEHAFELMKREKPRE